MIGSDTTVYKEKIGHTMGNKYDIGDVVYLTRYKKNDTLQIYKTIITDIEKEIYCPPTCYNVRKTRWNYKLKGFRENAPMVPRFFEEELFQTPPELEKYYFDLALKDAREQNRLWDTQAEYTTNQRKYTAFGFKLVCNIEKCEGALTRNIIDYTKKGK